jgi:hypothetical protein
MPAVFFSHVNAGDAGYVLFMRVVPAVMSLHMRVMSLHMMPAPIIVSCTFAWMGSGVTAAVVVVSRAE